jgi:tRNA (guanine-N7-)-methyltransferase
VSAAAPLASAPALLLDVERLRASHPDASLGPRPRVLEIGFGRGEVLMALAAARPEASFLAVEVSRVRAIKGARRFERAALGNVRVVHASAELLLERVLPERSFAECWINFPDPWPKRRHHKRRLVRPAVVRALARVLEPGARLHLATDHGGYAAWIAEVMADAAGFANAHAPAPWSRERPARPATAYEQEFLAEGRAIVYLEYRRTGP